MLRSVETRAVHDREVMKDDQRSNREVRRRRRSWIGHRVWDAGRCPRGDACGECRPQHQRLTVDIVGQRFERWLDHAPKLPEYVTAV